MPMKKPRYLTDWSGTDAAEITPDNNTDLVFIPRGVYIGTSGNLRIHDADGEVVTFTNIAAGVIHPIAPKRILSTGTTASGIVIVA